VLVPRVEHDRVRDHLLAADAGLLFYPRTQFLSCFSSPLKLFEYLACGLPVLATDLPTTREVIDHDRNGLLIDSEDPQTLADFLVNALRDEPRLRRLGARALADAQQFDYHARARRWLKVLHGPMNIRVASCT
jgi:glycosyltransferase involved in cell wall biosynthesis